MLPLHQPAINKNKPTRVLPTTVDFQPRTFVYTYADNCVTSSSRTSSVCFCGPDPIRTGIMLPCKGSAVPLKPRAQKGLHCHEGNGPLQTISVSVNSILPSLVSQYPSCTPADKRQKVTVTLCKLAFRTRPYSRRPPGLTPSPGTFRLFLTHLSQPYR